MLTRIGPYQLEREIGRGGMGVVYLGHDPRLHRAVAIKALPEHLASDPDRLARFTREARTLAQLSHPNVAGIFGVEEHDGASYLVLEYVEGETLADRLDRGPLPVDEALEIAAQIAAGVEAAHDAGVVHRDLKPGNVIVTPEGKAKLLDFGLARTHDPPSSTVAGRAGLTVTSPAVEHSPTIPGVILGTAAYMSPEQARGRTVDQRSDIWSFGVMLYEMLTGASPFRGETVSDSIGAVLHKGVDLGRLPESTPPMVRHVLRRCLERDKAKRYRDIGDALLDLEAGDETARAASAPAGAGRRGLAVIAAAVALGAALVAGAIWLRPAPPAPEPQQPVHFTLHAPVAAVNGTVFLSPQGDRLAYVAPGGSGDSQIWIRSLDDPEPDALPGSENALQLAWSPAGTHLAFTTSNGAFTVPAGGGPVERLLPPGRVLTFGGSWSARGTILFGSLEGVLRVNESGGEPSTIEATRGLAFWPSFLPDGDHLLFLGPIEAEKGPRASNLGVHVASLSDQTLRRLILPVSTRALYSDGSLLYIHDSTLIAQPFDPVSLESIGKPVALYGNLEYFLSHGGSSFSAAADRLVWVDKPPPMALRLVDREGQVRRDIGEPQLYDTARATISPDGKTVLAALDSPRTGTDDIVLIDLERGIPSRLTVEDSWENYPVWSPDGKHVAYASDSDGPPDIYRLEIGGEGRIPVWAAAGAQHTLAWSPDGREILFYERDDARIWIVPADGSSEATPLTPPIRGTDARFTPDGRWLVFVSSQSGRPEVYAQPYRRPGATLRISTEGGHRPALRGDGRELFYQSGQRIVAIQIGPDFELGAGATLFTQPEPFVFHDVTADGRSFLILPIPAPSDWQAIHVTTGWTSRLGPAE